MSVVHSLGWHFADGGAGPALDGFLASLPEPPRLLGLGEPTHGIEVFPLLRNEMLRHLVEHHGYRSVALESDCVAGLVVDDYVTTGQGDLDEVMATGFSNCFGALPSNRELVTWLRAVNADRDPADQVRFYGIDGPIEMIGTPSPRAALTFVHGYLAARLEPARVPHSIETIEELLGDESAWANPAAAMDPALSIGKTAEALDLRVITDDLLGVLESEAPDLQGPLYDRACMYGRTARGLLRYHAIMAEPGPAQISRLLAVRDGVMAGNLMAMVGAESRRGPSLVFMHNAHLQRAQSSMQFAGMLQRWWSGGAIAATRLGAQYAVIAADHALPAPGTFIDLLADATDGNALYPAGRLAEALRELPPLVPADGSADFRHFPLDVASLEGIDGVAFLGKPGDRIEYFTDPTGAYRTP